MIIFAMRTMNQIERFCDRELSDMQEICAYVCKQSNQGLVGDIYRLALIAINGELDLRKTKKEGREREK